MSLPDFSALFDSLPKRKVKLPQDYYDIRATAARDLAFTVSGINRLDALQAILDSLDANTRSGGTFRDWQRKVESGDLMPGLPQHRIELVFRMHSQTAYAHGKCRNFEENKASRPYLMYSAVGDSRTRPAHLKMDGVIRPVGDEWWAKHTPPNGFGCRCSVISLTEKQAKARGGITENPPGGHDPGWGYSPCSDRTAGEESSLDRKIEQYHPLFRGLLKGLMTGLAAIRSLFGRNR